MEIFSSSESLFRSLASKSTNPKGFLRAFEGLWNGKSHLFSLSDLSHISSLLISELCSIHGLIPSPSILSHLQNENDSKIHYNKCFETSVDQNYWDWMDEEEEGEISLLEFKIDLSLETLEETKCWPCKLPFSSLESFIRHIESHRLNDFLCYICGSTFENEVCVSKHIFLTHQGKGVSCERHQCSFCQKAFSKREYLTAHRERKHKCVLCSLVFKDPFVFESHCKEFHSQEPFLCTLCGWKSTTEDSHSRHRVTVHESPSPKVVCSVCFKEFGSTKGLQTHTKSICRGEEGVKNSSQETLIEENEKDKIIIQKVLSEPISTEIDDILSASKSLKNDVEKTFSTEIERESFETSSFLSPSSSSLQPSSQSHKDLSNAADKIDEHDKFVENTVSTFSTSNFVNETKSLTLSSEDKCLIELYERDDLYLLGLSGYNTYAGLKGSQENEDEGTSKENDKETKDKYKDNEEEEEEEEENEKYEDEEDDDKKASNKDLKCIYCNISFENQRAFSSHVNDHASNGICFICGKKLSSGEDYVKIHIKTVHENQTEHKCEVCGKCFGSRRGLELHGLRKHLNEFKCKVCQLDCYNQNSFLSHIQEHGSVDNFCVLCGILVSGKSYLKVHIKTVHENNTEHRCSVCGKCFGQKSGLKLHIERWHDEPSKLESTQSSYASCSFCQKPFSKKSFLKAHIRSAHEKRTEHRCDVCGRYFAHKQSLLFHIKRLHEQVKERTCEFCGKLFGDVSDVKAHIEALHRKLKVFNCHLCEFRFPNPYSLSTHVKIVHLKVKDFPCETCGRNFGRPADVKAHIKLVHKQIKDFVCETCGKYFGREMDLIRHSQSVHQNLKNYQCQICSKFFALKHNLSKHVRVVHEKNKEFECFVCHKLFSLKATLIKHVEGVHEGKRDAKCDICGKGFSYRSHVKRHKRRVHGSLDFPGAHLTEDEESAEILESSSASLNSSLLPISESELYNSSQLQVSSLVSISHQTPSHLNVAQSMDSHQTHSQSIHVHSHPLIHHSHIHDPLSL